MRRGTVGPHPRPLSRWRGRGEVWFRLSSSPACGRGKGEGARFQHDIPVIRCRAAPGVVRIGHDRNARQRRRRLAERGVVVGDDVAFVGDPLSEPRAAAFDDDVSNAVRVRVRERRSASRTSVPDIEQRRMRRALTENRRRRVFDQALRRGHALAVPSKQHVHAGHGVVGAPLRRVAALRHPLPFPAPAEDAGVRRRPRKSKRQSRSGSVRLGLDHDGLAIANQRVASRRDPRQLQRLPARGKRATGNPP